jgi:hypothetical protein
MSRDKKRLKSMKVTAVTTSNHTILSNNFDRFQSNPTLPMRNTAATAVAYVQKVT